MLAFKILLNNSCLGCGYLILRIVLFCSCYAFGGIAQFLPGGQCNLHHTHLSIFLHNYNLTIDQCDKSDLKAFNEAELQFLEGYSDVQFHIRRALCWGYEENCTDSLRFQPKALYKNCAGNIYSSKEGKWQPLADVFDNEVDFGGYIRNRLNAMRTACAADTNELGAASSLECSEKSEYCHAQWLIINQREDNKIFFGGKCKRLKQFEKQFEASVAENRFGLITWYPFVRNFSTKEFENEEFDHLCDVNITLPVIFLQLDSAANMFHHFCDFLNLYATQHMLGTGGNFSTSVLLVPWDFEKTLHKDLFHEVWSVFSAYQIHFLKQWRHQTVCIKNAHFALPPRMLPGLFYTPFYLPTNCSGSGLFRAFAEHVLYRMHINTTYPSDGLIRVTFLERSKISSSGAGRNILNQAELVTAIQSLPELNVQVVEFSHKAQTFAKQLDIVRNTDIFIGMHGAGLTHALFLPDHAVLFELFNCNDTVYKNVAQMRGIQYVSWPDRNWDEQDDGNSRKYANGITLIPPEIFNHKKQGANLDWRKNIKFANYKFDPKIFLSVLLEAKFLILQDAQFRKRLYHPSKFEEL